ncbi:hypothetical protein EIN_344570 [Entamoeba invadens IP1]|uniref:Uncharacterized protein n=1 Tax=Entamoeba invadens IP1 TaxID=370355 RepID=A0A0A1U381_ENTIV|nr:hypothetical protein EIN_344570 [Entamoeba invadens IP1]ELP88507.1 hypothetical protein EIN_344570 [Entamoeba invadens IP1]|eukprot:XP_004255278.1 hypothetical protein EIN_344570 [Entamoeba invadens IP1]
MVMNDLKQVLHNGIGLTPLMVKLALLVDGTSKAINIVIAIIQHHFPPKALPMLMEVSVLPPEWYISVSMGIVVSLVWFYYTIALHIPLASLFITHKNKYYFTLSFLSALLFSVLLFVCPLYKLFPPNYMLNGIPLTMFIVHYLSLFAYGGHCFAFLAIVWKTPQLQKLDNLQFRCKYLLLLMTFLLAMTAFVLYYQGSLSCGIVDCISYVCLCAVILMHNSDYSKMIKAKDEIDAIDGFSNHMRQIVTSNST